MEGRALALRPVFLIPVQMFQSLSDTCQSFSVPGMGLVGEPGNQKRGRRLQ
jgi:hypothetical protein